MSVKCLKLNGVGLVDNRPFTNWPHHFKSEKIARIAKPTPRTSHRVSRCHYYYFLNCQILSFWVLSRFEFLSCHNLSFVTILVFEFCHCLSFWVLSQFEVLSFVTIWVFEFCHNLSFWFLSQFEVLSFVIIRVFEFCHNSSWVLSPIDFLSFVTFFFFFLVFHHLSFGVFSQF